MIVNKRWFEAIDIRHSTRNYNRSSIEPKLLAALEEVCASFRPSKHVRAVLVRDSGENVFRGIIGNYGKVKGNPAYIAFIGKLHAPDVQEMIGYLGEAIILEATALGLATCWIGGFFRKKAVVDVQLQADEQVFAITPVGYPLEKLTFDERLMRGFKTERKRKPLTELVSGLPQSKWPGWVAAGLSAARLAPSAVNRQPWRFQVETDQVILSTDGKRGNFGLSRRLDCGIAMLHFELGASLYDIDIKRELLPDPQIALFTRC